MSAPAPIPPAGAPPSPPPPPTPEPGVFSCELCGIAVDLHTPAPVRRSSPLRVCPNCFGGFLAEDNPPPPPPPPPLPPSPPPLPLYCDMCGSAAGPHHSHGVPDDAHPRSPSSSPPPPPPPLFPASGSGSSSSSSELSDDPAGDDEMMYNFVRRIVRTNSIGAAALRDDPFYRPGAFEPVRRRQLGLPAAGGGGEPPASAASIAALPTVDVAEPAAACAICKDDLPVASQARRLPCGHLYHSSCIVTWLELHNSCPVCRFRIPSSSAAAGPEGAAAAPSEQDSLTTRVTIRFSTSTRRRGRVHGDAAVAAPISASPTQLAQAVTGDGAGGPANSGETVSSEWPRQPESDAVMSEAREGGDGFFDWT